MEAHQLAEQEVQASLIVGRLEEAVEKATEAANTLEQGGDAAAAVKEEDLGLKGESWQLPIGSLSILGKEKEEIFRTLEDLIVFEAGDENDLEPVVTAMAPLTPLGKLSLTVHSVAAYGYTLDLPHFHKINRRLQDDVSTWITHLFRLENRNVYYHEEPLEGLVRLTRMVLHYRFPRYLEDGYLAFKDKQPVLYGTVPNSFGVLQLLCGLLGFPLSCLNAVNTSAGSMDVDALKNAVGQDKAAGRLPLMVLADAGSAVTGHVDDLVQLQEFCKQNKIWLHVRGHSLATLALINAPLVPFYVGDSVSFNLSAWLGLPGLPTCTLYRQLESDPSRTASDSPPVIAGLVPDTMTRRLVALPLWVVLQTMGREGFRERIRSCFVTTHRLWYKINKLDCVRVLSRRPMCPDEHLPINEISADPATSPFSLFEVTATTIIFQFVPEPVNGVPYSGKVPAYYDKLNSWMGQILQRDVPHVNVEVCDIDGAGLVLRLCPLEGVLTVTDLHVDSFYSCLVQQLEILSATVRLKALFQERVTGHPQLRLVELAGWAGLGGVRYLPAEEDKPESEQAPHSIDQLNKLNMEIVAKLKSSDSAFSLGEGSDGLVCVRFGMVTADTDVDELLALVLAIGMEVEESARHLDDMAEMVKKGIEAATLDLQKETEERIWQDGILRQVPVFGSIVNWLAPKSETGVKGRSLNLQAGVVESTENIYRYHMQLQQGAASQGGSKPPPQPQVQTPVLPEGGAGRHHSRSSSHTSAVSSHSQSHTSPSSNTALANT